MSEAVIRGSMKIWWQFAQRMSHERRERETGEAREGEREAEDVDGRRESGKVDLTIEREVGGLEDEFERRDHKGGRVWGRN
jgi:hypothetical protein